MTKKKSDVDDSDLCARGIEDPVERKIMATAMKQGEDQINIVRESRIEIQTDEENSGD